MDLSRGSLVSLQLCEEAWIHIAQYFDNLKYFLRVWIVLKLYKTIKKGDAFWRHLLKEYCNSRGIDSEQVLKRKPILVGNDSFSMIEYLFKPKKCTNSGCFNYFYEWANHSNACRYHSGRMKVNKTLSCCAQKSFQSMGCKSTYHNGNFSTITFLPRARDNNGVKTIPSLDSDRSPMGISIEENVTRVVDVDSESIMKNGTHFCSAIKNKLSTREDVDRRTSIDEGLMVEQISRSTDLPTTLSPRFAISKEGKESAGGSSLKTVDNLKLPSIKFL